MEGAENREPINEGSPTKRRPSISKITRKFDLMFPGAAEENRYEF
jgi:hypothetical protein